MDPVFVILGGMVNLAVKQSVQTTVHSLEFAYLLENVNATT
jgi:hypothetical protein